MTDDEADELLHPPRQWPPLSAATAASLLLFPPLALTGYAALLGRPLADLLIPLVALFIVVRPAKNLFRGDEAGIGGGLGVVALVFLVSAPPFVARLTNGVGWADVLWFLPVVSWLLLTGFLVWWPATRRWCGLLPPADEDDE